MKRFQECNWLVKGWRYRHYIPIPFKYLWYNYFKSFYVTNDETLLDDRIDGRELWGVLVGLAQHKMGWYYTWEELKENLLTKMMHDDDKDGLYDYIDDVDDVDETEYWKGID